MVRSLFGHRRCRDRRVVRTDWPTTFLVPRWPACSCWRPSAWWTASSSCSTCGPPSFDAGVVIATALAAVVVSVEFCIVIGVFLSFVLYVPRAAQIRLVQLTRTPEQRIRVRLPEDPPCDRLLFYGLEGELMFRRGARAGDAFRYDRGRGAERRARGHLGADAGAQSGRRFPESAQCVSQRPARPCGPSVVRRPDRVEQGPRGYRPRYSTWNRSHFPVIAQATAPAPTTRSATLTSCLAT